MTVAADRAPVLELTDVSLWLPEGLQVLQQIDWTVQPGDARRHSDKGGRDGRSKIWPAARRGST